MNYVDGYVLPLPKKHLKAYQRMASKAGKIWMDHGALDYKECMGDDLNVKGHATFTKTCNVKASTEMVIFAYVVFKSRICF